jgi:hypothetical protein
MTHFTPLFTGFIFFDLRTTFHSQRIIYVPVGPNVIVACLSETSVSSDESTRHQNSERRHFSPEGEDSMFLQNVGFCLQLHIPPNLRAFHFRV